MTETEMIDSILNGYVTKDTPNGLRAIAHEKIRAIGQEMMQDMIENLTPEEIQEIQEVQEVRDMLQEANA
ncbi:MAG: hypothetical protein HQK94_19450 [Nitrospirae bacterium]|nr:hypothetical protein [Nitrospirota bacterium]